MACRLCTEMLSAPQVLPRASWQGPRSMHGRRSVGGGGDGCFNASHAKFVGSGHARGAFPQVMSDSAAAPMERGEQDLCDEDYTMHTMSIV